MIHFKNVCILLFVWLIGLLMGMICGYKWGEELVNKRLMVSTWNEAYSQGILDGGTGAMYMIFEDYIKKHPYKLGGK